MSFVDIEMASPNIHFNNNYNEKRNFTIVSYIDITVEDEIGQINRKHFLTREVG